MCSGDTWCAERILGETGPQLTWLCVALDTSELDITIEHTWVKSLEQLRNLRELTVHNFNSWDTFYRWDMQRDADLSHMTVCPFFDAAHVQGGLMLHG